MRRRREYALAYFIFKEKQLYQKIEKSDYLCMVIKESKNET